jgi:hypothetical protein
MSAQPFNVQTEVQYVYIMDLTMFFGDRSAGECVHLEPRFHAARLLAAWIEPGIFQERSEVWLRCSELVDSLRRGDRDRELC